MMIKGQGAPSNELPKGAPEETQIVFDLIDLYKERNNIVFDMPLTRSQVAEICQLVTKQAFKIEGIHA